VLHSGALVQCTKTGECQFDVTMTAPPISVMERASVVRDTGPYVVFEEDRRLVRFADLSIPSDASFSRPPERRAHSATATPQHRSRALAVRDIRRPTLDQRPFRRGRRRGCVCHNPSGSSCIFAFARCHTSFATSLPLRSFRFRRRGGTMAESAAISQGS
jgi:hypothetical protein